MNKKMNENNNNKKTRQIKNTIKKTMINKPPLNYRSNINQQRRNEIEEEEEEEDDEEPMIYQSPVFIPTPANYPEDLFYVNNYNNYSNMNYDDSFYANNSYIDRSPQPRPNIICPMPLMPDEKPINRQNISIIKDNISLIKYLSFFFFFFFFFLNIIINIFFYFIFGKKK